MPTRAEAKAIQAAFRAGGGRRAMFRAEHGVRDSAVTIEVQGLRAVEEHFLAVADLTGQLVPAIVDFTGVLVTDHQRAHVPIDTYATHDSIHYDVGISGNPDAGEVFMEAGPTTFYSPFLEYGTVFMSPRSFVIPSADAYEAPFITAMLEVAEIADQLRTLSPPYSGAPGVSSAISGIRHRLYSTQRFLGDLQVFGGAAAISGIRSGIIFLARALGDTNSIMRGTVGARIRSRVRGRVTGRIIGFGSATITHSQTIAAQVGGEAGRRVYQRVAGRIINRIPR